MNAFTILGQAGGGALNQGVLPTRGSLMLDIVFMAMFAIVPIMFASIWLVRKHQKYQLHKRIQITTAVVLLLAVGAFEIDMQLFTEWRELAAPSPWYDSGVVGWALFVHLLFAIPTPMVWGWTIFRALKRFPVPVAPGPYSVAHRFWGRLSAILMTLTAVTGWLFYYLAFVA